MAGAVEAPAHIDAMHDITSDTLIDDFDARVPPRSAAMRES
jgi:hypothetical protein